MPGSCFLLLFIILCWKLITMYEANISWVFATYLSYKDFARGHRRSPEEDKNHVSYTMGVWKCVLWISLPLNLHILYWILITMPRAYNSWVLTSFYISNAFARGHRKTSKVNKVHISHTMSVYDCVLWFSLLLFLNILCWILITMHRTYN